ncbi:MAG: hypothetical protein A3F16_07950 [Deltaproteobacteria bacterium RIFCSPHIGHO2_12_FULL_43_9]|nr:MAG: hypothetical protein A3F16_07950 [Deltaproteobacteria bacterium RIFCSPHIGHO2_12_FULL_43_9]
MKLKFVILLLPLLCSCGNSEEKTILPLEIEISFPNLNDAKVQELFLKNISLYRVTFSGNFGKRGVELQRTEKGAKFLVENIPFDSALGISVEVIGNGLSNINKVWVTGEVLALGETAAPINWAEGRSEPVKIICKLTEIGEYTYESIFNLHNSR